MKLKLLRNVIATLLTTMPLAATLAQSGGAYDLSWSTIDGGGGVSGGGRYAVSGTIGQPDAGQLTGGHYTLNGGFWVIQTEGVPLLAISRSIGNIVVKWPFPATDFVLQQTAALASPPSATLWMDLTSPSAVHVGSDWTVTIPAPAGNRFFRLRKP
jgi:hypothetical protein